MKEQILARLQEMRKIDTEEALAAADYAAGRSIDLMKAFCNIGEIPEELLGVGVSLAGWMLDSGMGAAESGGTLRSIREGDISVHFTGSGIGTSMTESEMLAHFMVELERFRRMNW